MARGEQATHLTRGLRVTGTMLAIAILAAAMIESCSSDDEQPAWIPPSNDGGTQTQTVKRGEIGEDVRFRWNHSIVFDKENDLEWERVAPDTRLSWDGAGAYCESLELDGGGWRLPHRWELLSVADVMSGDELFSTPANDWFWSATESNQDTRTAWAVGLGNYSNSNDRSRLSLVRCVRGLTENSEAP